MEKRVCLTSILSLSLLMGLCLRSLAYEVFLLLLQEYSFHLSWPPIPSPISVFPAYFLEAIFHVNCGFFPPLGEMGSQDQARVKVDFLSPS